MEFSHRSGRDLINVAKKRTNVIPIIEDARHPHKYRMLVGEQFSEINNLILISKTNCYPHLWWLGMVDVVFADVAQPDQARIVAINAHNFLKNGGNFMISIKVDGCLFTLIELLLYFVFSLRLTVLTLLLSRLLFLPVKCRN